MKPRAWWRALLPFARTYRRRLAGLAWLLVLGAMLQAATPWPTKFALDNVLGRHRLPSWIGWIRDVPGLGGWPVPAGWRHRSA